MEHPEPFDLEIVDYKEIMEHPKGSPGLLRKHLVRGYIFHNLGLQKINSYM